MTPSQERLRRYWDDQAARFDWSVIGPQVLAMYRLAAENRYLSVDEAKGRRHRWMA